MATSKIRKAIKLLDALIEKCGGPGGKPGPCPSGRTKPSSGGGGGRQERRGSPKKMTREQVKQKSIEAMPKGTEVSSVKGQKVHQWVKTSTGRTNAGEKLISNFVQKMKKLGYKGGEKTKEIGTHGGKIRIVSGSYRHSDGHSVKTLSETHVDHRGAVGSKTHTIELLLHS